MESKLYKCIINKEKIKPRNHKEKQMLRKLAIKHKLITPLLKINPLLKYFDVSQEQISLINDLRKEELLKVVSYFNKEKINYLLIKGFVLTKYYPRSLPRSSGDHDFIIRSIDDLWKCSKIMDLLGYELEEIPIFTNHHGKQFGLVKFSKTISDEVKVVIEFNISGFIINELLWLNEEQLWNNKQIIRIENVPIFIPSNIFNLFICIAETVGNKSYRLRDVIDFKFIVRSLKSDEIFILKQLLKKYNLIPFFKDLSYFMVKFEEWNTSIPWKICNLSFKIKKILIHLMPTMLAAGGIKRLYYYMIVKVSLFLRNWRNTDKILKKIENILDINSRFELGIVTYFVPIDTELSGKWKWVKKDRLVLVRSPVGILLVSHFCLHYEDELDEAKQLSTRLF